MVSIPEDLRDQVLKLKTSIRNSDIGRRYETAKAELLKDPEQFKAMDQYRQQCFTMAVRGNTEADYVAEARRLVLTREVVRNNPVIAEFLDAELEFCILLRLLCVELGETADLMLDGFGDLL